MSDYEIKYGDRCFAGVWMETGFGIGIVTAGEKGYCPANYPIVHCLETAQSIAERLNSQLGLDDKKVAEMILRSMRPANVPYFDR